MAQTETELKKIIEDARVEWNHQIGPQGEPAVLVDQGTWTEILEKLKLPQAGGSAYDR